jgi:hypothetical protein
MIIVGKTQDDSLKLFSFVIGFSWFGEYVPATCKLIFFCLVEKS